MKVVELHAVAQLVALESQYLGGATLVPLGSIRCAQNQGALQLLGQRLERNPFSRKRAGQDLVDALPERGVRGRARARGELDVLRLEAGPGLEQHGALEQGPQLADVSGPWIFAQHALGGRRDFPEALLELAGEAVHEEPRQRQDVLLAL